MDSFTDAFNTLMVNEGGYTDDPRDPGNWTGGKIGVGVCEGTNYGISAAAYPHLDIKSITIDDAKAIVKRDYWDPYSCDQMDARVAFQVLDTAYNGGRPAKWLQQAAGVTPDGNIGPKTLAAVAKTDPLKLIGRFNAYRLQYFVALNNPTFLKGWVLRIANNMLKGFS